MPGSPRAASASICFGFPPIRWFARSWSRCVSRFSACIPRTAAKLISDVDHHGAQVVLEHVSHQDAENLKEALERFGFSVSIIETSAPAVIAEAPPARAIAADVRREASRQEP